MSIAYYRFYSGDYYRKTRHLSLLQHGVYRCLIDLYMELREPLRNDLNYLYRWLHAESIEEKNAVEFVLGEFFLLRNNRWYSSRCDDELKYLVSLSKAGKRAATVKKIRKIRHNDRSTNVTPSVHQSESESESLKEVNTLSGKPDFGLLEDSKALARSEARLRHSQAVEIIGFLNEKSGRAFQASGPNLAFVIARLKEGATLEECRMVIAKKVREWGSDETMVQYLRPATLFNRTKFAQYLGQLVVPVLNQPEE